MLKYKAIHYNITNKRHATTQTSMLMFQTFRNYGLQTCLFIAMSRKMLGAKMGNEQWQSGD
jgi:hypothetical protein